MNIFNPFPRFLSYCEQVTDPDEFIPVMKEFVSVVGATNFLYLNKTSSAADMVLGATGARELCGEPTCPAFVTCTSSEGILLDRSEISTMFGEVLDYFGEQPVSGYGCCLRIASPKHRRAQLVLLGLEKANCLQILHSERFLPLLGMECDRRLRQLRVFHTGPCTNLSTQEHRCLVWVSKGKSMEEVGQIVGITRRTVEFHITNARQKLSAGNTTHAVYEAVRAGIL
jgi:DNA-binding CsgD family transcriptional regulator